MGTSRLKAEENRRLSAVGHPWRGCEERAQLPKLSPQELEKAAWFPELSSGPKAAAPGCPAQCRGSVAEPQNSPTAHLLEFGCSEPPHAQGCAPRDGATRGQPQRPTPRRGSRPSRCRRVAHGPCASCGSCTGPCCSSRGLSVLGGSGGGADLCDGVLRSWWRKKARLSSQLAGVSSPSAPGLSTGRGRSPGMQ